MQAIGQFFGAYFWLLYITGQFLLYAWPVTIGMLGVGVIALTVHRPLWAPQLRARARLLAMPYAAPLLTLLIGTIFRYHGPPRPDWRAPPDWYTQLLHVPLALQIALVIGLIVWMKGSRARALGAVAPSLWLTLCAMSPASFAIMGMGP